MTAGVRKTAVTAVLICLAILPAMFATLKIRHTGYVMADFRAFYCAGKAIAQGADPYRTEPLRDCEDLSGKPAFRKYPAMVIPAPLPGYALALFVPFARLPFGAAAALFALLIVFASAVCVVTAARITAVPPGVMAVLFSFAIGGGSLPFGQLVPVALGAICLAGWFAYRGQWRTAAIAASISTIEPHLGLPVCLALFLWVPRTRWVLGTAALALGALSIAAVGRMANIEYVMHVLPAQALAEAGGDAQYSLTTLLVNAGVGDAAAVRAGAAFYGLMLVLGVVVGGLAARRKRMSALTVFVPPAFAVFGGSYVHINDIAVAIPAALLLASNARRVVAAGVPLLVAVPWVSFVPYAAAAAPVFPVAVFAAYVYKGNARAIATAAACAAFAMIGLLAAPGVPFLHHARAFATTPIAVGLSQHEWAPFALDSSTLRPAWLLARLPTWIGLLAVISLATVQSGVLRRRRFAGAVREAHAERIGSAA